MDFSERWHRDPRYRRQTLEAMKRELLRVFPGMGPWDANRPEELATISGVFGAYPVPHAFGIPLLYAPDRWPALDPHRRLSVSEIERLSPEAPLRSAAVEDLLDQMELIRREWGTIHGYLNWQGVLNNALHLRGQELFLDIQDRPDLVRHLLGVVTEAMIRLAREVQARQRASGFAIDQFSVSNCVMNMVSPDTYAEFVFPHDRRIAESFGRFGVHTCNWNISPYIEPLSRLPRLGYLDMGITSDLARVRATFPDTYRAVLYSPVAVQDAGLADIRKDLERVRAELAPCDVVFADLQATIPEDRVRAVVSLCAELSVAPEGWRGMEV